jgi:hypothetical protein
MLLEGDVADTVETGVGVAGRRSSTGRAVRVDSTGDAAAELSGGGGNRDELFSGLEALALSASTSPTLPAAQPPLITRSPAAGTSVLPTRAELLSDERRFVSLRYAATFSSTALIKLPLDGVIAAPQHRYAVAALTALALNLNSRAHPRIPNSGVSARLLACSKELLSRTSPLLDLDQFSGTAATACSDLAPTLASLYSPWPSCWVGLEAQSAGGQRVTHRLVVLDTSSAPAAALPPLASVIQAHFDSLALVRMVTPPVSLLVASATDSTTLMDIGTPGEELPLTLCGAEYRFRLAGAAWTSLAGPYLAAFRDDAGGVTQPWVHTGTHDGGVERRESWPTGNKHDSGLVLLVYCLATDPRSAAASSPVVDEGEGGGAGGGGSNGGGGGRAGSSRTRRHVIESPG